MADQNTALIEAQARFDLLFFNSVDGVFFLTLDEPIRWDGAANREELLDYAFSHLRVSQANPAMCAQMGTARDNLIGSVPADRWKDDAPRWRSRIAKLFDEGRAAHDSVAPRDDGSYIHVEGSYVCLYDDQGRITGYFGTQRDNSKERKMADRLELAMTNGEIGVFDLDLASRSIYFDKHWLAKLGFPVDEIQTAEWWSAQTHPSDLGELQRVFQAHLAGKTPSYRAEHRVRTADGRWLWVLSSGRITTRDRDGNPLRVVGTAIDITERKQLQERVALAERMASIGTLAAGVAHEINNPLTYIVLNLTLLERQLGTCKGIDPTMLGKLRNMVGQARYGTDRVSGVVRDLQSLTRVRDDLIGLVDLGAVLERCFEIADHQVRHRARLLRELSPVPPVRGSEGRLVQLFLNLVINAAQAIPEGSADQHTIRVRTLTAADGRVRVEVIDTGGGIAPDAMSHIFDPFFTTKALGEGSGLGLAICRTIVSSMGGEIEVESELGHGTTFIVTLPVGAAVVTTPAPAPQETPGLRILVVDDEPLIGKVVEQVLTSHVVIVETSARTALARVTAGEKFDRILCDLMMPDMTGMDFYQRLPEELQKRVVFLSGGAFTERSRAFLSGVTNRRLEKPFDTEALAAALAD